jgi:diguanylate cyclase (GGDEF)-like protein
MGNYFNVILIFQAISAVLIGWLLLHFAKLYQRAYLFYWSISFFCLNIYLIAVYISSQLSAYNLDPSSLPRLINLFLLSTAGYLQIAFLMTGTITLVRGATLSNKALIRILVVCMLIAASITLFKNWTDASDDANLRYLIRVGLRYLVAGMACIGTAIYILRYDAKPLLGKKLVTIGFFVYGFEMGFLGWLTLENFIFGESAVLLIFAPYHGLFELLLYPFICVGLVVWLLEVERIRRQQSFEKLQNLNQTDGLTGLPSQRALHKHLQNWQQLAQPLNRLTLTLIGIDQMQRFNDAEGIKKGDEIITTLAKRLEFLCIGGFRFFGRLHGDVFVIISRGFGDEQLNKAQKLRSSFSRPLKIKNKTYYLEMSAGSTSVTPDLSVETILHQASQALQLAKQSGGRQHKLYQPGIRLSLNTDLIFENELRAAFKREQFEIYYQPIWSSTNTIVCFEALIRWNHPKKGLLTPNAFLTLVHDLGLMVELDKWVSKQAIKQIRSWQFINPNSAKITVNVSAETVQNGDLVPFIKSCLKAEKVKPNNLTMEITENTAMHNIESGRSTLTELKKLGVHVAIDDFGTGYSSLNYLKAFPSDVIKFDRSFVSDIKNKEINLEILRSLVPLCHRLNKKVVIEGIENREQYESMQDLGINAFQGYYLSHPITTQEAEKLLFMSKKSNVNQKLN